MKRKIYIGGAIVLALVVCGIIWNKWFSTTKIGFLNYQVVNLGQISKANNNSFIKIEEVSLEDLDNLNKYDMLFINGMGLRITEDERELIQKAADKGLPTLSTMVTNPSNNIISLDSVDTEALKEYLGNGGKKNYRSLLNYVRKNIDKKIISVEEPEEVALRANDMLYHIDPQQLDEELGFNYVKEYNKFLHKNGLWKDNAPQIIITGQIADPTELITALEETGNVVYPIRDLKTFIETHQIDSIQPTAIINMAHGRLGDFIVNYLTKQNIPLFSPLNVNRLVDKWEEDKMGMSGGFLSQSVVTPEIDGAIRSYALFGHYLGDDGLQQVHAIPERLNVFVQTVNNYIQLKRKSNKDKHIAIYYYKGPGKNALTAGGMEVVPSIYNLLLELKKEGYTVNNLPKSSSELEKIIQAEGSVLGTYAEGAMAEFMKKGHPEFITKEKYDTWVKKSLRENKYNEVVAKYGEFPGKYMVNDKQELAISRIKFGNVVLLPQYAAGAGDDSFKIAHGTDAAPPHNYIASYLWTQHEFKADAIIHFGTHGSLEFTPKKQVALSHNDWADRMIGATPHFYIYSIGNVGEGLIAKRRSYAGLQTYLTPPFMESSVRGIYRELIEAIQIYNNKIASANQAELDKTSLKVKALAVKMGMHRDLGLDSILSKPYNEDEILQVENFAEELATEKIAGQLYTMGIPYSPERITSSVFAMAAEPIAYSRLALDKLRKRSVADTEKHKSLFTRNYLNPANELVKRLLNNPALATDQLVCQVAEITMQELTEAREIEAYQNAPKGMMAMMMASNSKERPMGMGGMPSQASAKPTSKKASEHRPNTSKSETTHTDATSGATKKNKKTHQVHSKEASKNEHPHKKMMAEMMKKGNKKEMMKKMQNAQKEYTKEQINKALSIIEVERTIKNVANYRTSLLQSPIQEMTSMINALNGGYTKPSPGGDPIAKPNTIPTGRNMYGINAEATPSESAWDKGVQLAKNTIEMYRKRHNDSIPRKVSYTLWSGEFIETEGATIAQVLYMLGVEPIRDAFGRVSDLRLIPSEELGRPRIDVVVQTSGQLRDLAASRLFLINRAVEMAATADDKNFENQIATGIVEAERALIDKGITPKEARMIATYRVFGGVNGNYGTNIQAMVQSGDRWENEAEIAEVYLNNMGAFYGNEKAWETFKQFAFETALKNTDVVIQPRQSNTWGALSLDHVYEFMGGLNLAVRNVTGKDPDAYFSDYRNRNNVRMQELKESIGVESRTTIFNPAYIKEKMKGEASSAGVFAEIIQNTYGWNVMKPKAIDTEMWDEIYNVYVKDKFNLGVQDFFETKNPAALEEITAVMMETARKGMWKANQQQLAEVAKLHTTLVAKHAPSCSGFVCDNKKLQQFIASKTDATTAQQYKESISKIREASLKDGEKGMVMKKEEMNKTANQQTNNISNFVILAIVLVGVAVLAVILVRKRRKKEEE